MADIKRLQDPELLAFQIYIRLITEIKDLIRPGDDVDRVVESAARASFRFANIFLKEVEEQRELPTLPSEDDNA